MSVKYYTHPGTFVTELGEKIENLVIAYHTFGNPDASRSNAVWVCHALTANSDVADWWPHTVESGAFLDPTRWYTICANILGSHYGTTGPLSINPETGLPYYGTFPKLTIRDMARAHALLADHLELSHIHALVGCSVGGFQALEWAAADPGRFGRLILVATDAKASPWTIAIDQTQRMAIMADSTYGEPRPDAGMEGMAAARAIGLLTYRGPEGYNTTQQDPPETDPGDLRRACTYQLHQGEKLCRRYNAYSYVTILDAFDTHDIGRGRGGLQSALDRLCMPAILIGIKTDIVFTPAEMKTLAASLPNCIYREIDSPLGHDGFLTEYTQLNNLLTPFIND